MNNNIKTPAVNAAPYYLDTFYPTVNENLYENMITYLHGLIEENNGNKNIVINNIPSETTDNIISPIKNLLENTSVSYGDLRKVIENLEFMRDAIVDVKVSLNLKQKQLNESTIQKVNNLHTKTGGGRQRKNYRDLKCMWKTTRGNMECDKKLFDEKMFSYQQKIISLLNKTPVHDYISI